MSYWIITNTKLLYDVFNLVFFDKIYGVVQIIFMLITKHMSVACVIECVVVVFLKLRLLKLKFMIVITKALPFGTQCFLVAFFNKLALVLTLKLLEIFVLNILYVFMFFKIKDLKLILLLSYSSKHIFTRY